MQTKLPDWALALLRKARKPLAKATLRINSAQYIDRLALQAARDLREDNPRLSGTTGTWAELMFVNGGDFTAVNTTAVEATLLSGINEQPTIPSNFFFNKQGLRRGIILEAQGVLGTTSTQALIFQVRMSSTVASATLSGATLGVPDAIPTASGVSNRGWN